LGAKNGDITDLIRQWESGCSGALDKLIDKTYDQLKEVAQKKVNKEYIKNQIKTTELLHEACAKVMQSDPSKIENRSHYIGLATTIMQHFLVDEARKRKAARRGSGMAHLALSDDEYEWSMDPDQVLLLDQIIERMEAKSQGNAQFAKLYFFAGYTLQEISTILDIPVSTLHNRLKYIKASLALELREQGVSD
jgi:RNA polymerase sigma factor (TIGR02999 family)